MIIRNQLLDAFFAGIAFSGTWGLAQVLSTRLPGLLAWFIAGALVCLTQTLVLQAVFGMADDDDEDGDDA